MTVSIFIQGDHRFLWQSLLSIFSILYQRGIYPPENFKREQKYGLTLLVTDDEKLKEYISNVLKQVKGQWSY